MRLEVAIGDNHRNGGDKLLEVVSGKGFWEAAVARDIGEELAATGEVDEEVGREVLANFLHLQNQLHSSLGKAILCMSSNQCVPRNQILQLHSLKYSYRDH